MTDNLDGTYTYNYSVSRPGQITISVLQYTQGGVYQEYFNNNNRSGNNQNNGTTSQINFNWGSGVIYSGVSDNVSASFYFRFKGPITGVVTFYIYVDDDTTMTIGNYYSLLYFVEYLNIIYLSSRLWFNYIISTNNKCKINNSVEIINGYSAYFKKTRWYINILIII